MKVRDNVTGILVAGCVAAIVGFALWLNFAPCLSVSWDPFHCFQADGWTVYEAWCVRYNESRHQLRNWLKVRKTGEKPVILRAAASVRLYPRWTTRKFVYGLAVNRTKSSKAKKNRRRFVFRVNPSGKLEVCTEIENIHYLGSVDDQGKDGQTDWVRLRTWSIENLLRPDGWLTIRFDRCVDGSDLVSFSGRLKSRLHKYGLCADPFQHFIGAVPNLTVNDIVFDEKAVIPAKLVSPAKTPSRRSGSPEGAENNEE